MKLCSNDQEGWSLENREQEGLKRLWGRETLYWVS